MRKYRFKRGYRPSPERLEESLRSFFGSFERRGEVYVTSYGAMKEMRAWFDGKLLCVETETDPDVSTDVAADTVRKFNKFLEHLTGYTAKERRKQLQKEAEGK